MTGVIAPEEQTKNSKKRSSSSNKSEPKKKRQKKETENADANTTVDTPKKKGRKKKEPTTLMVLNPLTGNMVPAEQPKKQYKKREKDPSSVKSPRGRKSKNEDAPDQQLVQATADQTTNVGAFPLNQQNQTQANTLAERKKQARKTKAGAPTITAPQPNVPATAMLGSPRAFISGVNSPYMIYNKIPMPSNTTIDGQPTSANAVPQYGYQMVGAPPGMISPKSTGSPARKIVVGTPNGNGINTGNGSFVIQSPQGGYTQQFYAPYAQGGNPSTPNGSAPIYHVMQPYQYVSQQQHQQQQQQQQSHNMPAPNTPTSQPTTPTNTNPNIVFVNMNKGSPPMYAGPNTPTGQSVQRYYFPNTSTAPNQVYPTSYAQFMPMTNMKPVQQQLPQQQGEKVTTPTTPSNARGKAPVNMSNKQPSQNPTQQQQLFHQQKNANVAPTQQQQGTPVMISPMYFNQMGGSPRNAQMAPRIMQTMGANANGPTGMTTSFIPMNSQTQILHAPTATRKMSNTTTNGAQFFNSIQVRPNTIIQQPKPTHSGVTPNIVSLVSTQAPTQTHQEKQ
jgi:hypothetical protein